MLLAMSRTASPNAHGDAPVRAVDDVDADAGALGALRQDEPHAGREPGDETRARIVDVALELIADHGFAATSTREISERLGFTKAALYYHFHTKDDLLAAIVEPVVDDLRTLVESTSPAADTSERRRVVEGYVELVAAHADLMKVLANDPAIRRSAAFRLAGPLYDGLERALSGSGTPGTGERARVRAALGAVHFPILRAEPGADRRELCDVTFAAACAVLGLPSPRRPLDRPEGAARDGDRAAR